jgi:hypothetical protein
METQTMKTPAFSKNQLSKIGSFIFSSGMFMGIASLPFGLVSCGGGGDASSTSSNAPTIAYMTAVSGVPGIIAAPAAQSVTIYGSNFVSGTSVTVTNNITYPVSSTTVVSPSEITTSVTIPTVPNDSYVTVTLQPPGGNSVSAILGVAHAYKTLANDIQPIFVSNNCVTCHDSTGVFDMSTVQLSAANLIQAQSLGCPQNLRVTAGDPRRTSNVLVDVIKTKAAGLPAALSCNNLAARQMPQGVFPALSAADIEAIVDWIALGAN